jgi:hypothetical protein
MLFGIFIYGLGFGMRLIKLLRTGGFIFAGLMRKIALE